VKVTLNGGKNAQEQQATNPGDGERVPGDGAANPGDEATGLFGKAVDSIVAR
jgi:hypothetical protein